MFGLTTKKKYNKLKKDFDEIFIKYFGESLKLIATEVFFEKINKQLKSFESKEFRKKELEQYFAEARANGLNPREHLEVSWKEYQYLFQKESCETKKNLLSDISSQDKNKDPDIPC